MAQGTLYISAHPHTSKSYYVNVETFLSTFVYRLTDEAEIDLQVKLNAASSEERLLICDLSGIKHSICYGEPETAIYCKWPVILSDKQVVSGLCSVSRFLLKTSNKKEARELLGFREACLLACSESSIWTRFCEIDAISMTEDALRNKFIEGSKYNLPKEVARFEYHLSMPVRMHNVYKEARAKNNDKDLKSSVPINKLNLEHTYSEGTSMTLADVILYPCFLISLNICPKTLLETKVPLTIKWLNIMKESFLPTPSFQLPKSVVIDDVFKPDFIKQSLYTADPARYRPEKRIHTKQHSIETAIKLLGPLESDIRNDLSPFGSDVHFNWLEIPNEANPNSGALPAKRANRKCEQLENIVKAVVKIAAEKQYVIVDFCSGSGHVGILLAVLLPKSRILLVENKEKSLARAKERITKLNLQNVLIIQSNLDYFVGKFDVGVALHACGVATDLVIETCVRNGAHFVVCPCCYGGVKNCHHLTYPRSNRFRNTDLNYDGFLSLAHAADQTHDENNAKTKQGYFCMDVVDTDRRLYGESCGYVVHLGKLQPTTCTNKNNLLVGIFPEKA